MHEKLFFNLLYSNFDSRCFRRFSQNRFDRDRFAQFDSRREPGRTVFSQSKRNEVASINGLIIFKHFGNIIACKFIEQLLSKCYCIFRIAKLKCFS